VTSDVINAAEDPSPVLWTSPNVTFAGAKAGNFPRDSSEEGSPRASSCEIQDERRVGLWQKNTLELVANKNHCRLRW